MPCAVRVLSVRLWRLARGRWAKAHPTAAQRAGFGGWLIVCPPFMRVLVTGMLLDERVPKVL